MIYNQIDTSIDPNIIGTKKETHQIIIDKTSIDKEYYQKLIHKKLSTDSDIKSLKEINTSKLKAKLVKDAKFTDIMKFSPFLMSTSIIVSQKFIECLSLFGLDKEEYELKEIEIEGASQNYFLFFTKQIELEKINFEESKIYRSLLFGTKPLEYFQLKSFEDYKNLSEKYTFLNFETLAINEEYIESPIVRIQGALMYFLSQKLFHYLAQKNISNLFLCKDQNIIREVKLKIIK